MAAGLTRVVHVRCVWSNTQVPLTYVAACVLVAMGRHEVLCVQLGVLAYSLCSHCYLFWLPYVAGAISRIRLVQAVDVYRDAWTVRVVFLWARGAVVCT